MRKMVKARLTYIDGLLRGLHTVCHENNVAQAIIEDIGICLDDLQVQLRKKEQMEKEEVCCPSHYNQGGCCQATNSVNDIRSDYDCYS